MLITSATSNVLAYASATDNSVQVGGQAGDVQVDAYAEFDPKTGALKTGYSTKTISNTQKVSVSVNEQSQFVDVFPYDFLGLLALPDGALNTGDNMSVNAGLYTMNINVASITNGLATLRTTMTTDKKANLYDGGAKGNAGGTTIDMNTQTMMSGANGMSGVEGMQLSKEDQAEMDMGKAMSPDMTCDIISNFNYQQGMFQNVNGTVTTTMDAMGMKMNVVSVLEMKKL